MLSYHERRHRLNSNEIVPVRDAVMERLQLLVEARDPERLDEAGSLFRIWYRIHFYVRNKPSYPPHESFEMIKVHLPYGTVMLPREVSPGPGDAEEEVVPGGVEDEDPGPNRDDPDHPEEETA